MCLPLAVGHRRRDRASLGLGLLVLLMLLMERILRVTILRLLVSTYGHIIAIRAVFITNGSLWIVRYRGTYGVIVGITSHLPCLVKGASGSHTRSLKVPFDRCMGIFACDLCMSCRT